MSWKTHTTPFAIAAIVAVVSAPADAHAQRRHHGRGPTVIVAPYYYGPYYNPFFWGFHGWGYPPFYPPFGYPFPDESAARLQVTPRETEVYVDGFRAGIVDDFDGISQRLRLPPGDHVIELYLDGYQPVTQTIMFTRGQTYRLRLTMEPLAPGDPTPARPAPRTPRPSSQLYDAYGRPVATLVVPSGSGVLAIRVQPADAVVLVNGERWQSSSSERLEIQVSPGSHRIEVQKEGYQPFTTDVQVGPGETAVVNISLTRSGSSRFQGSRVPGQGSGTVITRSNLAPGTLELWNPGTAPSYFEIVMPPLADTASSRSCSAAKWWASRRRAIGVG